MRPEDLAGAQCTVEVGVDDLVPLALGYLKGGSALDASGTIDEDVHAAKFGQGRIQQGLQTLWVIHVRGQDQRAPAGFTDCFGGGIHQIGAPAGGHDVGPGLRQALGQGQADS